MNHKDPLKEKLNDLLNGHSLAQLFAALEAVIQELNYPEVVAHLRQSRLLLQPNALAPKQTEDDNAQCATSL
jgi:hypothetical protein